MAFVLDILLAFMLLRRETDNPKQLSQELNLSRSSLMAVRSGKSIAAAAATKRSKSATIGSSSKTAQPVDETSPLKQNEETPGNEDDEENLSYVSLPAC
jgi:hypothetical protein